SQGESGKLRSALAGWRPDLGRNGNTAQHRQETGSELLSIHPRPGQRSDADALPGGPDQATSRNHESQFFVEAHVTVPGLLRRYEPWMFAARVTESTAQRFQPLSQLPKHELSKIWRKAGDSNAYVPKDPG